MRMTERLESMLAGGRDDAMLRFGLGSAYAGSDEPMRAVPHLEACIDHDPAYSAAYKLLGRTYFDLEDYENACRILKTGN